MGNMANRMSAKAGGLADVSSSLVAALYDLGADVHVALPHYRRMFNIDAANLISDEIRAYMSKLSTARIHLAEDRCFYYRDSVYGNDETTNVNVALAFQREVINNIIPSVDPDLIHCNDWMTGLIPAVAKRWNIPSLFTVHNIHTYKLTLQRIEDAGIDAANFWKYLFFDYRPTITKRPAPATPLICWQAVSSPATTSTPSAPPFCAKLPMVNIASCPAIYAMK
jgi:starch synthase